MVDFCSTVEKTNWLFCVGVLNSRHRVGFQVESVLQSRGTKMKFYIIGKSKKIIKQRK